MSTSHFTLDYAEYDALLAERFDAALAVVGEPVSLRLSPATGTPPPDVRAPRVLGPSRQQRPAPLTRQITLRGWTDALLADARQAFAAQPDGEFGPRAR